MSAPVYDPAADPCATPEQREWFASQFEKLTVELEIITPSDWAEQHRYLTASMSSMSGYYRWEITPYLREIIDCLGVDSPVRELAVMKGSQIGATVGIFENLIGYLIDHVKTCPVMLVTADSEMVKQRLDGNIIPMLESSGLSDRIKSADENNARKTGKTDKRIEWIGGGSLVPLGAQNPNKYRSLSVQVLLNDELDAWPLATKDGDPLSAIRARTDAYESSRKIAHLSTPRLKGTSKIAQCFEAGDQRRYFVNCLACGHGQTLRWKRTNHETGEETGIVWEMKDGRLVPGSVRYLCEACGHAHTNDDKTQLLAPEHGAEWRPTAEPSAPDLRSYHIPALLSPPGMHTWEACVLQWLAAWDVVKDCPRDLGKLQEFYNNVLGEPWEAHGEKVLFAVVSEHRRSRYSFGEIPNGWAEEHCGSPVLFLTCTVDVHADNLAVAVFGWCRGRRSFLVDYWRFQGDPAQLDDQGTWCRLRELIESRTYVADDGRRYRITVTLIDSGYLTDQVYRFCSDYESQVYPIKGTDAPIKGSRVREFSDFTTTLGQRAFMLTVDLYKDRLSASLRRQWDGLSLQPDGMFNAPANVTDAQLKELTREVKRERLEPKTRRVVGYFWQRPAGSDNELWDLAVYANAAVDIIADDVCREDLGLEAVDPTAFWNHLAAEQPFSTTG